MRRLLTTGFLVSAFFLFSAAWVPVAHAANTVTWGGGGTTTNWSDCANWVGGVCPGTNDIATFNGTSNKDVVIDASTAASVAGISITSAYAGTISQQKDMTLGSWGFSQAGGVFNQSTAAFTSNGFVSISGGSFLAAVGTSTILSGFSQTAGGTYTASSTRALLFNGNGTAHTITCVGTLDGLIDFNQYAGGGYTIASGCTVNTVASVNTPEYFTIDGTINFGSSVQTGSMTIDSGGTVTMSASAYTVAGSFSQASGATFDTTGKTLTLNANGVARNFTCTGTFAGTVDFNAYSNGSYTVASGCTINTASSVSMAMSLTVAGTVNFGTSVQTGSLTINSGGVLTVAGSALTVVGNYTEISGATFAATGKTLTMNSNGSSRTFACSGTFPGLLSFNTAAGGSYTVASGCAATLASNISATASLTIAGTLSTGGHALSASRITVAAGGTLRVEGSEVIKPPVLAASATIEYYGSGTYASLGAGSAYSNLSFTGAGSWATSTDLTVNGDFTQTAGTFTSTGTLTFASTTASNTITTSSGTVLKNVTLNKSGQTLTLAGSRLSLSGNLTLTAGTLDASAAGCSSAACNITLAGNWVGGDNLFTPRTSTVTLNGTSQQITGTSTFYTLSKTVSSADTLTFGANQTQTVTHLWTAAGASGNLLSLVSGTPGTQWKIDPQGTRTVAYASPQDSNNTNATALSGTSLTDGGNNTNWSFNSAPTTPSSLGPTANVDGSWSTSAQPTLSFTTSDPDGNNVQYEVQIATDSGFSTLATDYLSSFAAAGATSYTVGQTAGTYLTGSSGQTLADGSYYWRVKAGDTLYATSSYATANSGAIAFKIDATAPTAGTVTVGTTTTSTLSVALSGASDAGSGLATLPYLFYESVTGTSSAATSSTAWTLSGLSAGTTYSFTVGVTDLAGNTATTSVVTGITSANPTAATTATAGSIGAGIIACPLGQARVTTTQKELLTTVSYCMPLESVVSGSMSSVGSAEFPRDLEVGMEGVDVYELQKFLNAHGFLLAKSGPGSRGAETQKFGALTVAALRAYQSSKGLPAAGYFGPLTRATITLGQPAAVVPVVVATKQTFTKNLSVGVTDTEVRALQKYLNTQGFVVAKSGPGSPGNETDFFGAGTHAALISFQDAHRVDILVSVGLAKGNGFFGPSTRSFVNG